MFYENLKFSSFNIIEKWVIKYDSPNIFEIWLLNMKERHKIFQNYYK